MTNVLLLSLPPLLFAGQLLAMRLGSRLRVPRDAASNVAVAPVVGMVLSLMGLVLGFSFSNAAGRLDASRKSILDEANACENTLDRIQLAEPDVRPNLQGLFRAYLDARIRAYEAYDARLGLEIYRAEADRAAAVRTEMWDLAVAGTTLTPNRTLLLSALGAMADTATARKLAIGTQLPPAVFLFLLGIVLLGALLIGVTLENAKGAQLFYRFVAAAVLSSTIYTILDMEYPRLGFFRLLTHADALLVDVRRSAG